MSEGNAADWVSAIGTLVGALGVVGGLLYTGTQIRTARLDQQNTEHWRRSDFARALIDRLSTDDELSFCTRALDWGVGPLIVPEKYRVLFEPECARFDHRVDVMVVALRADLDVGWDSPEALTYRYCFDALFSYLDSIRQYLADDLVHHNQLIGLNYYLTLVRDPPYVSWHRDDSASHPFISFITRFYPELYKFIWKNSRNYVRHSAPWWTK
jgi:hypothetical protein